MFNAHYHRMVENFSTKVVALISLVFTIPTYLPNLPTYLTYPATYLPTNLPTKFNLIFTT